MSQDLALIDGQQLILEDTPSGRRYALQARVDGALAAMPDDAIGPALSALYAQALAALMVDPTLGGLVTEIREGLHDGGPALELHVTHEAYTGASGVFGLQVTTDYVQAVGAPSKREAVFAALLAALAANDPSDVLSIRERVLQGFRYVLELELGTTILRNAPRPVDATTGPVFVLLDGDQRCESAAPGFMFYTAEIAVEVFVAGTDPADLDAAMQIVLDAVHNAETLGGLAFDVHEGIRETADVLRREYTGPLQAARLDIDLEFFTRPGDPYTAP